MAAHLHQTIVRIAGTDKRIQSLLVGIAGALLAFAVWEMGWTQAWEARTWDWRVRILAKKSEFTDQICLILVDQNSLDWGSRENGWSWPWPREVYGVISNYCKRQGARMLVMDVLFTEPSPFGEADDERMGESLADYGRVVSAMFAGEKTGSEQTWPEYLAPPELRVRELDQWTKEHPAVQTVFSRATFPIPEVSRNSRSLGNVHLNPDHDGVYRRTRLFSVFDGKHLPSLGLAAFLADNPAKDVRMADSILGLGAYEIPLDQEGNAILRYRGPAGTHRAWSAAAVLQSELRLLSGEAPVIEEQNAFKDKYVFLGFSAPGLYDLRTSPAGGVYPGVEIHATMLDNLLARDFIRDTPAWAAVLLIGGLSLACALSVSLFAEPFVIVGICLLFICIPPLMALSSCIKGIWFPFVVCELAVLNTIFLSLSLKYATEGRQKRFIKLAFAQYLSPAVIEQIIADPDKLRLGGERRELSIFFSDLEAFTSISEKLEPDALVALLNEYLSAMTDIIIEEGGTVDKYEGDAIIAFWNAPLAVPDHAVRCVKAALRCQARLAQMRPAFFQRIGRELNMRIGMNTGYAVAGNLGSQTKFDYTIIGDAVNLAARLEGANKEFGTYTMISGNTRNALGESFGFREIARLGVVGKVEPVTVFEPMYLKEYEMRKEIFRTFAHARELYYQGNFAAAADSFSEIAKFDSAAEAYEKKCRELMDKPPENWKGIWIMTKK
ncbi:MAG: adenylate/guanylate cyclase domain-containing protein [Desulfobacterales bacterium]